MRIKRGSVDGEGFFSGAGAFAPEVSEETAYRAHKPSTVLLLREPGTRKHTGLILTFTVNPQSLRFEQKALVGVQQGRGGYVVTQNGLTAPHWTLSGNFGWRLRTATLPHFVAAGGLGAPVSGPSQVVPRNDNDQRNIRWDSRSGLHASAVGAGATSSGNTLDGQQAWYALRDFIGYYFDHNQHRIQEGKPPLEMVWYDSLHSLKWVVVPEGLPTLERSVSTQGLMPYTLTLIGVYDDARRLGRGWRLLDAWDEPEAPQPEPRIK